MKTITLLAVLATLLVDLFGPKSGVGGPMTSLLVAFLTMLIVGIYEAWANTRGPLGWIINIVLTVAGGFLAISLFGLVMDWVLTQIHFQGVLAASNHPIRYVASVGIAIFTVLGSWLPLKAIDRFR